MNKPAGTLVILHEPELLGLRLDPTRCIVCGAEATRLCDGVLAQTWDLTQVWCSRPLCEAHSTRGGPFEPSGIWICGEGGCEHDHQDFCPACVAAGRHTNWWHQVRPFTWMGIDSRAYVHPRKERQSSRTWRPPAPPDGEKP